MAFVSADRTQLTTFNLSTRRKHPVIEHSFLIFRAGFSADGNYLIVSTGDGQILRAEIVSGILSTGKPLNASDSQLAGNIQTSPQDAIVAASAPGPDISIWDFRTGNWNSDNAQKRFTLEGHTDRVFSMVFSPDGNELASGSVDETIRLWNVQTGDLLAVLEHPSLEIVTTLAFSPDGNLLATGDNIGHVFVWDLRLPSPVASTLDGHKSIPITALAFNLSSQTLLSADETGMLRAWEIDPEQWARHACAVAGRELSANEIERYSLSDRYRPVCTSSKQ